MASFDMNNRKDNPSVELNLVPFIDLMCVCITFLLITAAWTEISMVKMGSNVMGQQTEDNQEKVDPVDRIAFRMDVKNTGITLTLGTDVTTIPKVNNEYNNEALSAHLAKIKEQHPNKTDAIITISNQLPFNILVAGMDELIDAGFPDIGIAAGEVN